MINNANWDIREFVIRMTKSQTEFKGKRVLLFQGCERQILPHLRALKQLGCETYVLCNSKLDIGYASRLPDHKILGVCTPKAPDETASFVKNLIKAEKFDVVIPMGDFAAGILAEYKEELSAYSKIAVNKKDVFFGALDKLNVMKVCSENGIACPKTIFGVRTFEDLLAMSLKFPLVVKPRNDCGARGFHRVDSIEELKLLQLNVDLADCVIQEYIPQTDMNMSCGLFIDKGKVKSAYTYVSKRWYPLKGGTGTLNQLVDEPEVVNTCAKLAKLLQLEGICGFDLIFDHRDKQAKIIEVNPRVLACTRIGFEAGCNQAQQVLEQMYDYQVTEMFAQRTNLYIRMSQIDFLWFLKSPERFKSQPSWLSIKNTKDQTFFLDDPFPWFAFLFSGLFRLKKENEARE